MQIPVVIMGAAGRMGNIVAAFVRADAECRIAALVERAERLHEVRAEGDCLVESDVEATLSKIHDAVIIDFTAPESSVATARAAARLGASHVVGTTGLSADQKAELEILAGAARIFWSPNMSVGISVLTKILPELVRLLGESYDMEVLEIHHNRKKDAPSGTALRLAEALAEGRGWNLEETARCCREGITGERPHREIGIQALRGGDMVGVHTAYFFGPGERIEVTHQAHSRENFAQGALRAAKWLHAQKPGRLYTMGDLF